MKIIDGKKIAAEIRQEIQFAVQEREKQGKRKPHLAIVLVGNDLPSLTYVNAKRKVCKEVGFDSTLYHFDENLTENELLQKINRLNQDDAIDGFIVQLPLPPQIDEQKIIIAIRPEKDVDGFHPTNIGKMVLGFPGFISATPLGILELLKRYAIETAGKHCVVVGRSNIVGTPISILIGRNREMGNATVTLTHSYTENLEEITRSADILIVAVGNPQFITGDMVKRGAVVIDVGITRVSDATQKNGYRLSGDVDFSSVAEKASFITPVPGGVGPMTITSLLKNTLKAADNRN